MKRRTEVQQLRSLSFLGLGWDTKQTKEEVALSSGGGGGRGEDAVLLNLKGTTREKVEMV